MFIFSYNFLHISCVIPIFHRINFCSSNPAKLASLWTLISHFFQKLRQLRWYVYHVYTIFSKDFVRNFKVKLHPLSIWIQSLYIKIGALLFSVRDNGIWTLLSLPKAFSPIVLFIHQFKYIRSKVWRMLSQWHSDFKCQVLRFVKVF